MKSFQRPKDGFFVRAESFFNVATEIENMDAEPACAPPVINSHAWIYQLTADAITRVAYRQTAHYQVARHFLENPQAFFDGLG